MDKKKRCNILRLVQMTNAACNTYEMVEVIQKQTLKDKGDGIFRVSSRHNRHEWA